MGQPTHIKTNRKLSQKYENMKFSADFHIHSRFSRATSHSLNLPILDRGARQKGLDLIGTGDFTHPQWFGEISRQLEEFQNGIYRLKNEKQSTCFFLTSEISCIYKKAGKVRKIHILVTAPSLTVAEKLNREIAKIGNIQADGRPMLGIDAKELLKIVLDVSPECLYIPAHCLTPWFSIFGSKSGFDSIDECFDEYSQHIYALETGLSADPNMIWRIPDGRRLTLISNSDAHSEEKLGREANFFDCEMDYAEICRVIKEKDNKKFLFTAEFYPQEGKYFHDGHSACSINFSPAESKKFNNICPVCGSPLVIGVLNRVEQLADQPNGFMPENAIPCRHIVPLKEIIAGILGKTVAAQAVQKIYDQLIKAFGNEFNALLNADFFDIQRETSPEIADGIARARKGDIKWIEGYDGVFGRITGFAPSPKQTQQKII